MEYSHDQSDFYDDSSSRSSEQEARNTISAWDCEICGLERCHHLQFPDYFENYHYGKNTNQIKQAPLHEPWEKLITTCA